jgi:hypothetical protein
MKELTIEGVDVHLEKGKNGTNWGKILDHLEKLGGPKEEQPKEPSGSQRSLRIARIEVRDVKLALTLRDVPVVSGSQTLTLPPIVIENYDSSGSTLDLVAKLTRTIVSAVLAQAMKSGAGIFPADVIGELRSGLDGLKDTLEKEAGKLLENLDLKGLEKPLEDLQDIFKKPK